MTPEDRKHYIERAKRRLRRMSKMDLIEAMRDEMNRRYTVRNGFIDAQAEYNGYNENNIPNFRMK